MLNISLSSPPLKADKGLKNGSCNRGSCQEPGATFFNRSTKMYYCEDCAAKINSYAETKEYCMETFGSPELCVHDDGPYDLRFKPLPYLLKASDKSSADS
jgi:hypothetical protein